MALNQFMHPRNIYKDKPPNFEELAGKYEEFRKFCKISSGGRVLFNFKNPDAVRSLTQTLLLENFGLEIELPSGCLVPRVPQRLNYVLWIEDILKQNKIPLLDSVVTGIDVGTGASCIYPLLGVSQCHWRFLATEKDAEAARVARGNAVRNGFQDLISVVTVEDGTELSAVLRPSVQYHFTMCNPPFFDSSEVHFASDGGDARWKRDRKSRPAPHSSSVARPNEVAVDGGEVSFVSRIIQDSLKLGTRVGFYSSMIGKKSSLKPLKQKLGESGVAAVSVTTLCQGKTQRWVLAWTFVPDFKLNVDGVTKPKSVRSSPAWTVELHGFSDLSAATNTCLKLFQDLKMKCEKMGETEEVRKFECTAWENSWAHCRRKRRAKRSSAQDVGARPEEEEVLPKKRARMDEEAAFFLVKFGLVVERVPDKSHFLLSFHWIDGINKDLLNQIWQYAKNAVSHNFCV